jgi:hypothetical protein
MELRTEYEFFLPKGFVDDDGAVHRKGTMRLATARDELEPLRDPRVRDADDPFLTIIVLSRVVTRLGSLSQVTPREIERLFAADLAYLQDLYGAINFGTPDEIDDVVADAQERQRAAQAPRTARASAATAELDVDDDADEDDDEAVDELDDTVDADELVARLQAQFGDQHDDDETVQEAPRPSARRRRIEEITVH